MEALVYHDGKNAIAEVPDAAGELHGYVLLRPAAFAPPALFVRQYRKVGPPREGAVYTVRLLPGGRWDCDCPDHRWRHRRNRGDRLAGQECKHCEHARGLRRLAESL